MTRAEALAKGREAGRKKPRALSPEMKWIMENLNDKKAEKKDKPMWTAKLRWIQETATNKSWFMRQCLGRMMEEKVVQEKAPEEAPEEIAGKIDVLLAKWEAERGGG